MQAVLDAVAERLVAGDEMAIRIPEICDATGVNYGSVYHHFGSREGVIDSAYNMMFSRLVEEDLAVFREVNDTVDTFDEFVNVLQPIVATLSSGPKRRERRALRIRIVAAAATRPRLKQLIGATQARLTEDLCELTTFAQKREWLRDDIAPEALAVLFQMLIFGRALDDVSNDPIDEAAWQSAMGTLFLDLLRR